MGESNQIKLCCKGAGGSDGAMTQLWKEGRNIGPGWADGDVAR